MTCDPEATGGPCSVYLTAVTGLDFGPDGSLYVVSFAKHGLLASFGAGITEGALYPVIGGVTTELAPGELTLPGDVAVAPNGTVYVTNQSVFQRRRAGRHRRGLRGRRALRRPPRWLRWRA